MLTLCEGKMNRTHPQNCDDTLFGSEKSLLPTKKGCCQECSGGVPCTRRCICICFIALLILAVIVTIIVLVVTVGIPSRTPVNRLCVSTNNKTGFLCDDREPCIPASQVCDGIKHCGNGEDEQETLCTDLPSNLPGHLIFRCINGKTWIHADKRCNGINDCGDCSDERGAWPSCPPCGPEWWRCRTVFYMYCDCIPRSLCQDRTQHCIDWSDEAHCTR